MKIYLVGGAVRDYLLGLPIKERDWVVVGATENDMLQLGFKRVGKKFPVFLHPKTNEEYALARREHKVEPGYKGFTFDTSPNVSLKDDLIRRDLTINAMAQDPDTGEIIDPYGGKQDIQQKILRHVSQAFSEDPVRILRVGRLLARYYHLGFSLAPETNELMKQMTARGEVNALVAERVWKELHRALNEVNPEQFFYVLEQCQALNILFPNLTLDNPGLLGLKLSTSLTHHTLVRFAILVHALPDAKKSISALSQRYRVPNAYRELALLTANHYQQALLARQFSADKLLKFLSASDCFRREQRFKYFLEACSILAKVYQKSFDYAWFMACAATIKTIDVKEIINNGFSGEALAAKLTALRREKIEQFLTND